MAETVDSVAASPTGEEAEERDETASEERDETPSEERDETPSLTELLAQLGRELSVLAFCEAELAAARNLPEVRRASRDVAGAVLIAAAFVTAFAFANVAALHGLARVMPGWLAALVLCGVWIVVGMSLLLALIVRAGHVTGWRWWRVFRGGTEEALAELERARAEAEKAVRETLGRLVPVISLEIASAAVPAAGDMAAGVVDVGGDLLESSDRIVEAIAEELPGGGVVNQMWDVVLMPGRFGVRVATTVLKRGGPSS